MISLMFDLLSVSVRHQIGLKSIWDYFRPTVDANSGPLSPNASGLTTVPLSPLSRLVIPDRAVGTSVCTTCRQSLSSPN